MLKIFQKIKTHKISFGAIAVLLAISGYYGFKTLTAVPAQASYVLAVVQKGTLISSVSGSGQISVSNQIEVKPKASGDILSLGVKQGQEVKAGAVLARIDSSDAQKAVRDAQASLQSAQISLQKIKQPADSLSLLQAQNALVSAQEAKKSAQDDLAKAYEDGFNSVANAFLDLPGVVSGVNNILYNSDLNANQGNLDYYTDAVRKYDSQVDQYRDDANSAFQKASAAYNKNFADYKITDRSSDINTIESLISETYQTTRDVAEAIKSANNLIQFYEDKLTERLLKPKSLADTQLASLNGYTGKINTHLSSLLATQNTIASSKQAIIDADRTIAEKTESLAKVRAGTDQLDIQSQELSVKQKENALADARANLADYTVRAPFDGVIAKLNVQKGDSASASAAIATLITKQRIAEISLNEVDAAKIKIGQKATLTFDAIDGLNVTGEVAEIDALGTVSQGVVTYNVKIVFDTQDERVKPGMSVTASIIINIKQDVLMIPNSAVKSSNNENYVEMPSEIISSNTASIASGITLKVSPKQQIIQIGLANDSFTEVVDGLKEGDNVISRVISAQTTTSQSQGQSLFQLGGNRAGGTAGGATRASATGR